MCGILGIINKNGKPVNDALIDKFPGLLASAYKRGPDASRFIELEKKSVLFGSNRLAIVDLRDVANMPMMSHDGSAYIAFNGEIYNFKEIKKILRDKGYIFYNESDTEVVLNAYLEWGTEFVKKLNGMFAFAIWDSKKRKLILGRDRYGIKPLFYYENESYIIFSSDIRSILVSGLVTKEINYNSLTSYIYLRFSLGTQTMIKSVNSLDLAEIIEWDLINNNKKSNIYWTPAFSISQDMSIEYGTEKLKSLYIDSVKKMTMGDVKSAILLSGGIDSASIVGSLRQINNDDIFTYSCKYENTTDISDISKSVTFTNAGIDETGAASYIASHFNTIHQNVSITENDIDTFFSDMIADFGQPHASTDAFGHYMLAKKVGEKFKVVLAGIGSDEFLGGYTELYFQKDARLLKNNMTAMDFINIYSNLDDPTGNVIKVLKNDFRFTKYFINYIENKLDFFPKNLKNEILNKHACFEMFTDLPGWELDQADRLYMASSVEVRPTFLDNDLINFLLTIPASYKYNNGIEKWVFKKAMKDILPLDVINRKKFPSLSIPRDWYNKKWFTDRVANLMEDPLPYWDMNYLKKNQNDFELIYRVIVFEEWYRNLI